MSNKFLSCRLDGVILELMTSDRNNSQVIKNFIYKRNKVYNKKGKN